MKCQLKSYKDFFQKRKNSWAFGTAACQFAVFLLAFLLLCFSYALMEVPDGSYPSQDIFISKFEKYLTLTSALLVLIPFLFSFILTFGLLHKHQILLDAWLKGSVGFTLVFSLGLLSAGIYLSVEGSYIGYITIVLSLVFSALMVHSILLVYYLNKDYKVKPQVSDENEEDDGCSK